MPLSKITAASISDNTITNTQLATNVITPIAIGGVEQEYEDGGTNYRSHSFLTPGPHRFSTSTTLTIDFLIQLLMGAIVHLIVLLLLVALVVETTRVVKEMEAPEQEAQKMVNLVEHQHKILILELQM
jgi:hypothetical protein